MIDTIKTRKFILPTSITDGLKRLFFLLCFGGRSALFLLLAALDGGFYCGDVHNRRFYRLLFGDRYHRHDLVLVDRNLSRLREHEVGHFYLVFQSNELGHVYADSVWEFGRLALNFDFVYNLG